MVKTKCPRCGYLWDYKGRGKPTKYGRICCPKCQTTMTLKQAKKRALKKKKV